MKRSAVSLAALPALISILLTGCGSSTGPTNAGLLLLRVDYHELLDNDTSTNWVFFNGVDGAKPESTVIDQGNFPELDLRDFFRVGRTDSSANETSALLEGLSDYLGHTYGRLFLSGHFADPFGGVSLVDIPPTSIGLLATNRAHQAFDTGQTALVGRSLFDLSNMKLTAADLGKGGDLYAQGFPFRKIGRWEAVSGP
jgi:hypothetical protein